MKPDNNGQNMERYQTLLYQYNSFLLSL